MFCTELAALMSSIKRIKTYVPLSFGQLHAKPCLEFEGGSAYWQKRNRQFLGNMDKIFIFLDFTCEDFLKICI